MIATKMRIWSSKTAFFFMYICLLWINLALRNIAKIQHRFCGILYPAPSVFECSWYRARCGGETTWRLVQLRRYENKPPRRRTISSLWTNKIQRFTIRSCGDWYFRWIGLAWICIRIASSRIYGWWGSCRKHWKVRLTDFGKYIYKR